jgi:lipoprotein-anchoring transpeptidase ErfK/SrfK
MNIRLHWLKTVILAGVVTLSAQFPACAREIVGFGGYEAGTVVIVTHARELYYVLGRGQAIRYPVGVGKAGMAWHGKAWVAQKLLHPSWGPPDDIARDNPNIPRTIPGGAPNNPMGAAVLGLNRGNYAIHGTNDPASIGGFVSHGCIRMRNEDVLDLYNRVPLGSDVFVLQ